MNEGIIKNIVDVVEKERVDGTGTVTLILDMVKTKSDFDAIAIKLLDLIPRVSIKLNGDMSISVIFL